MRIRRSSIVGFVAIICTIVFSCADRPSESSVGAAITPYDQPPQWAQEAVWYQLFVERFRNGDHTNDPTLPSVKGSWLEPYPDDWSITNWEDNWYAQEDWAKRAGLEFYSSIQMRRYGGDIQGVIDKIDYLKGLGVTAIYFNPVNDAPSLHKFDARNYRHIDVNFGPDPDRDRRIMAEEDPADPTTWQMTSADSLFFVMVDLMHEQDINVIVDFSWNHTGSTFWAFEDIKTHQSASKYKDWYEIKSFDDPNTDESEFEYEGWFGISTLPDIKKTRSTSKRQGYPYEGNMYEGPKNHIFSVTRKYLDPNGDGNVDDGIDGMRLDVAEHVPMGFWRDFRKHVRSINPEFYLVGENWWTSWPDSLMDPVPWVQGDVFDAVMHYHWYKPARHYFHRNETDLDPMKFKKSMDSIFLKYPEHTQRAMMNMSASHDSPRLATSMSNRNKYKYNASARANSQYNEGPVTDEDYDLVKLFLLHEFTWIGSPQIWMGDEMGMTGGDDPDNRKPLMWPDIDFASETNSDYSDYKYDQKITRRDDIADLIRDLSDLRRSNEVLVYGQYAVEDSDSSILTYSRSTLVDSVVVILNMTGHSVNYDLPVGSTLLFTLGDYGDSRLSSRSGLVVRPAN